MMHCYCGGEVCKPENNKNLVGGYPVSKSDPGTLNCEVHILWSSKFNMCLKIAVRCFGIP
jgi:hypothetical protein